MESNVGPIDMYMIDITGMPKFIQYHPQEMGKSGQDTYRFWKQKLTQQTTYSASAKHYTGNGGIYDRRL